MIDGKSKNTISAYKLTIRRFMEFMQKNITEIGTYDISIQPYEDCCTVFLPKHPVTKPKLDRIEKSESALDVKALVDAAVESEEVIDIRP